MKYAILGAGGFAKEVREVLLDLGTRPEMVQFYVEERFKANNSTAKGFLELPRDDHHVAYLGVGDGKLRANWLSQFQDNCDFAPLIHPAAILGNNVQLGKGVIVTAYSHLTCDIIVGDGVQFNLQTTVGHDCVIGDYVTTAPKVAISGNVRVGTHVSLGTSSTVLPGVSICDDVVVGAGAVVTKDITEPGSYIGVPAKRIS